jgi:hypothetical protein
VLVLVEANPNNEVVDFINDAARNLAWVFRGLFDVDNEKLQVLLNYGVAALVYLGLARLIGSFAPSGHRVASSFLVAGVRRRCGSTALSRAA